MKSKERALRIVLGMALAIIIAIVICSLIWWFAGNHSFDILGRYINYAGFILIGVGADFPGMVRFFNHGQGFQYDHRAFPSDQNKTPARSR